MFFGERENYPPMDHLNEAILAEVRDAARAGLDKDDILTGYSLKIEQLTKTEVIYFDESFNYGRFQGLKLMGEKLQDEAKRKGGAPAALAFLRRFSKSWEGEDGNLNSDGFHLTINTNPKA